MRGTFAARIKKEAQVNGKLTQEKPPIETKPQHRSYTKPQNRSHTNPRYYNTNHKTIL